MAVRWRVLAAVLFALLTGCSRTGVQPTTVDPTLSIVQAGRQWLQLVAFSSSQDPEVPPCEKPGVPSTATMVNAFLHLERVNDRWVAELDRGPEGRIVLSFRYAGYRSQGGYALTGTIEGEAADDAVGTVWQARDVKVRILGNGATGAAGLDGVATMRSLSYGNVSGHLIVSSSNGESVVCPAAMWVLQPSRQ